jgi:ankyrin repeat protein
MNIPQGTLLYRGLGGSMELPDTFFVPSQNCITPNALGYCEFAFMSTTQDRSVAVQYSGVRDNKPKASIMEIHPNSVDRGADISEFSQYPGEKEFLIVPYSFVQGDGRQRTEITDGGGILTVISARVNINLKTETVEQLLGKKKSMHIAAFKSVIDETKQWLHTFAEDGGRAQARAATEKEYTYDDLSWFISETLKQMQRMKDTDAKLPDDDYVNDLKYKALVTRMLSSQEWAKQKLRLWLENQETDITSVGFTPLKSAHRQWLSFLKQRQHAVAVVGSVERKTAAVKILQCKGLMVTNDASTEEADGEPLIYAAAADGWALDDLQFVIDAGASLSAENKSGDSALHAAAENGDALAVQALVKAGADVEKLGKDGRTPLHLSAAGGHIEVAKLLIECKADFAAVDGNGRTPLHQSASGGHIEVAKLLIECKADFAAIDNYGRTPLHQSADNGRTEVAKLLVECKADFAAVDLLGLTPLHLSAFCGHTEVAKLLVECKADFAAVDKDGRTPLHQSAAGGYAEVAKLLVECKADFAAVDKDGRTPLHQSAFGGYAEVAKLLIECKADLAAVDKDGRTPLHSSAERADIGYAEVAKLLVECKADLAAVDKDGRTPLHSTAVNGHTEVAKLLIECKADFAAVDKDGRTPLHQSAYWGNSVPPYRHTEVAKLLVHAKSDVAARTSDGRTPLKIAIDRNKSHVAAFLRSAGAPE